MRLITSLVLALLLVVGQGGTAGAAPEQLAQATLDRAAASLAVEKATLAPKETLRVSFTASATYPHDTFVFIVPSGTPHGSLKTLWEHDVAWQRLEKRTGGVLEFTAPTAEGKYDLRMAESAEGSELASVGITVRVDRDAASLAVPKPVLAPQEAMPVTFTASATYPHDTFVFVVPNGTPDKGTTDLWNHDLTWQRLERRTDGTLDFTAPKAEGTYDLRMAETSNDAVLTVLTFTVAVDREAASLAVPKPVFAPQESMPVTFTASATYPHDTFVFVVPNGTPDKGTADLWNHDLAWQRLERRTDGTLDFTAPKVEGTYDLRMAETTNDLVLTVLTFTVAIDRDAASLSLPKPVYAPQEPMPVTFTASETYPHDTFVFLVPHAAPHEGTRALWEHDLSWKRLERRADGVLEFNAPKAEGRYDLRMAETSNDAVLRILTFTVAIDRAAASLSLPKTVYAPQEPMPVTFTASATYPHDSFVFLVPGGTPHEGTRALWDEDLAWQRLERRADGVLPFTAPKAEGTYDLRMAETSNDVELLSVSFTVAVDSGAASLSLPQSVYAPRDPVPVAFTASKAYPHDTFIFLVPQGTPRAGTQALWEHDLSWKRLERRADGTFDFAAPNEPGAYDLRMAETSNNKDLVSVTFRVAETGAGGGPVSARGDASAHDGPNPPITQTGGQAPETVAGPTDANAATNCAREKETYAQAARGWHASGRDDAHRRTMLLARKAYEACRANAGSAAATGAAATSAAATGVAAPTDGAAGYAGVWDSSEGRMTLTASGNRVSGPYTQDNGAIVGTVTGTRFDGVWIENGSARRCDTARDGRHHWGRLVFERTGDTLTGQWSYCDDDLDGAWTATRVGPAPDATTADADGDADADKADPDEPEKPDLTIREDLDVSGLIQQIETIMADEEGQ